MDVVLLARIQFALTIIYHFIFPPITFGLGLMIVIFETLYLKKDDIIYKDISNFLIKLLAVNFVLGTATGITMEFSFGNNWSNYSRVVGDIFGAPLAAEGVFAFFLESMFLGVLVFGRNKVSKKAFWWSALFVMIGSHLSGFWIIIANSWMQTPAGYEMVDGVAKLTDFFEAAINHSTFIRFTHMVLAGWLTGVAVVMGIGAYYVLKGLYGEHGKRILKISAITFIFLPFIELGLGHIHAIEVYEYQPVKMAAFEALWKTQKNAPMAVFGIPSKEDEKTYFNIEIPSMLSLLIHFNPNKEVKGLDAFPKDEWPPIFLPFMSYHIMIGLGSFFILLSMIIMFLMWKNKLFETKWFLYLLLINIPLPLISTEVGWMSAEVGRQPWAVWHIIKTSHAASVVVPAWQILLTIILFTIIYSLLFVVGFKIALKIIKKGPVNAEQEIY